MILTVSSRRTAACLTFSLLATAAAVSGCERRPTDPQVPATTAPAPEISTPPSASTSEPAMPPASAASQ